MKLKKWLICFCLLLFVLFILEIVLENASKIKHMRVTDENIDKINSLFKYLNLNAANNVKSVSISPILTDPEDYNLNVVYDTGKTITYNLYTSSIRNSSNPIKQSIDYIRSSGYLIEGFDKYEMQIDKGNIDEISSLINYFNINDIQTIDSLMVTVDSNGYNINIKYLNNSDEYSVFKGKITDHDMYSYNPILNAIEYIKTNCNNYNEIKLYLELRNILNIIIKSILLIGAIFSIFLIYRNIKNNNPM